MSDTFCKALHTLLQAHHFLSLTTFKPVALSAQDKLLWMWMKDRHDYFTSEGKAWFDNQDKIASACGCSLTAAKAFIAKLRQHGYLAIEKRRIHECAHSNSMTIARDLILPPVALPEAIPKPVMAVVAPEHEHVPDYAPIVLPSVTKPAFEQVMVPPVLDLDDDGYDDALPWMRGAA
jgi:hypothetical protein